MNSTPRFSDSRYALSHSVNYFLLGFTNKRDRNAMTGPFEALDAGAVVIVKVGASLGIAVT